MFFAFQLTGGRLRSFGGSRLFFGGLGGERFKGWQKFGVARLIVRGRVNCHRLFGVADHFR